MKIPAPAVFATFFLAGAACAQKPPTCDAPAVQQQVKEVFYTQMLNNGRAARAERFADPYSGTPAAFQAGIERARPRLQPEIKLLETVDQGYHDQAKARLCQATLVVADNRAYAVAARYFVQRTTDGSPKIATEFLLPGGGGAGSFNAMIAYFDHFYEIAFRRDTNTESPRKTPIPSAPVTGDASSTKSPSAAEPTQVQRPEWCSKAGTHVERMICADDGLSALDAQMYAAYKAAEAAAADKKVFYAVSRAWRVNRRDACTSVPCIAAAYKDRLKELGG
ncbi:hypothetical protein ACSFBI_01485 [Variovorax sp. RB3P1]|uniref:hypothetical protein n=1 Tax=Variovorax sp. RB3P1 TaxID=3443732 RepID=UPI003F477DC7